MKSLADIYCVSPRLKRVELAELKQAGRELKTTFPKGFSDWMLKFGEGEFSGYVMPYRPSEIVSGLAQNRELLRYDFWQDGELVLEEEERTRLVVFANTIDSDMFAFDPADPDQICVFPRHHTEIYDLKGTFLEMLDWVATSGKIVQPFKDRYFHPNNGYATIRLHPPDAVRSVKDLKALLSAVGKADHLVTETDYLGFFVNRFGLHVIGCLGEDYRDVTVHLDVESANECLPLLSVGLRGQGFRVTEFYKLKKSEVDGLFD